MFFSFLKLSTFFYFQSYSMAIVLDLHQFSKTFMFARTDCYTIITYHYIAIFSLIYAKSSALYIVPVACKFFFITIEITSFAQTINYYSCYFVITINNSSTFYVHFQAENDVHFQHITGPHSWISFFGFHFSSSICFVLFCITPILLTDFSPGH